VLATRRPGYYRHDVAGASLHGRRLLIPITNVVAIVLPAEVGDAYRAPLP